MQGHHGSGEGIKGYVSFNLYPQRTHSLMGDGSHLPAKITNNVRQACQMSGYGANTKAAGARVEPCSWGGLGAGPGKLTPDGPCFSTALFCAYMGAALSNIMSVVSLGSPDTTLKCPSPARASGHLESCDCVLVASTPYNTLQGLSRVCAEKDWQ